MIDTLHLKINTSLPIVINHIEQNQPSMTWADKAGIAQAVIALLSVIGLGITVILQLKSSKDQKNILVLERNAKRAEYFPQIHIRSEFKPPQVKSNNGAYYDVNDGIWNVQIYLTVHQNPVMDLQYVFKGVITQI